MNSENFPSYEYFWTLSKVKLLHSSSCFRVFALIKSIALIFLLSELSSHFPPFLEQCACFFSTAAFFSSSHHSAKPWTVIHGRHLGIPPASFLGWLHISVSCLPVCPHLLSRSRHRRRRRPSSGPPPPRSSSLGCWGLRSCHLNCQSLWTSLIGRGGRLSTGGWDTHTHTQRVEGDMQHREVRTT